MSRHALSASSDAAFKKLFSIVDDTSSLAGESLRELASILEAIKTLSDPVRDKPRRSGRGGCQEHTHVHTLAGIGQDLADNRISLNEFQREELDAQLASLFPIHSEGVAA